MAGTRGRKGEFMRQLRIREPWADLAYRSDQQLLEDLASRIQILEARVRELEAAISVPDVPDHPPIETLIHDREKVSAGV